MQKCGVTLLVGAWQREKQQNKQEPRRGYNRALKVTVGTLRYRNADALKYATIEERLGRERSVRGGKLKLRFVASDATSFSSLLIWLLSGKL